MRWSSARVSASKGQVVEADGGTAGLGRAGSGTQLEQAEVVVVAAAGRLEEGGPAQVGPRSDLVRKPSTSV